MITTLGPDDLNNLCGLGREWFSFSGILGQFNPAQFKKTWTNIFNLRTGTIIGYSEDGIIHGVIGGIFHQDVNTGEKVATEMFWYVTPAHRGTGMKLLRQFERWAKRNECRKIRMTHLLEGKSLEPIYERLGYRAVEVSYEKGV